MPKRLDRPPRVTALTAKLEEAPWHLEAVAEALSGQSFRQIAARHGVTVAAAYKAVKSTLSVADDAPTLRAIWNARVEVAVAAIWPKVQTGDLNAINALERLLRSSAELNGLKIAVATATYQYGEIRVIYQDALGQPMAPVIDHAPARDLAE